MNQTVAISQAGPGNAHMGPHPFANYFLRQLTLKVASLQTIGGSNFDVGNR
jgi:hypothetical protein